MTHDSLKHKRDNLKVETKILRGGTVLEPHVRIDHLAIFDRVLTDKEIAALYENYDHGMYGTKTYKISSDSNDKYRIRMVSDADTSQTFECTVHDNALIIHLASQESISIMSPDVFIKAELVNDPTVRLLELINAVEELSGKLKNEQRENMLSVLESMKESIKLEQNPVLRIDNSIHEEEIGWGATLAAVMGAVAFGAILKNAKQITHEKTETKKATEVVDV